MSAPRAAVLIVDDDEGVRRFTVRALRKAGYDARPAATAREALELLSDEAADYALLLADVWLDAMSGPDLATLARDRRPTLNVLFMTGDVSVFDKRTHASAGVLGKPFATPELLAAVARALQG